MKKVNLKLIAVAIGFAMAFSFSSCKKYEEGGMSLAGKKGRVVNVWQLDSEFSNGKAETLDSDEKLETLEFTKDNKFTWTSYTDGVADDPAYKGEWEFNGNKTAIGFKADNSCAIQYPGCDLFWYITILKLKKNEMWIGEPGGNDYSVYKTK